MTWKLTPSDISKLAGVHPALRAVVIRAAQLSPVPFAVIEGRRSLARQKQLVATGTSWTMHSNHLTGRAVDLAPLSGGTITWSWPAYFRLAPFVKRAALELSIPLAWGGDWKNVKDGPHWELKKEVP